MLYCTTIHLFRQRSRVHIVFSADVAGQPRDTARAPSAVNRAECSVWQTCRSKPKRLRRGHDVAKSEQAVQKRQHEAASLLRGTGYYLRRIPPKLDESTVQVVLGTCPPGKCPLPRGIWTHGFHRPIRIYLTNQFTCGLACSGHGYVPDRNHHCEAPADKRFGAYWSQKVQLWWQQFLLIFLRTNVRVHGVTKKCS